MFCHPSAQIATLIRFPSPKLALEFIGGLDKEADVMAVDVPSDTGAGSAEDAPTEAVPTETEGVKTA